MESLLNFKTQMLRFSWNNKILGYAHCICSIPYEYLNDQFHHILNEE
jgi:hypothetical protein